MIEESTLELSASRSPVNTFFRRSSRLCNLSIPRELQRIASHLPCQSKSSMSTTRRLNSSDPPNKRFLCPKMTPISCSFLCQLRVVNNNIGKRLLHQKICFICGLMVSRSQAGPSSSGGSSQVMSDIRAIVAAHEQQSRNSRVCPFHILPMTVTLI